MRGSDADRPLRACLDRYLRRMRSKQTCFVLGISKWNSPSGGVGWANRQLQSRALGKAKLAGKSQPQVRIKASVLHCTSCRR